MWRWDQQEPFGNNPANEDPDGNAIAFELPLRLPGQYFDKETNSHYNMARDYDPAIGRYIQADPMGVLTTTLPASTMDLNHLYIYSANNPISYSDPTGLYKYANEWSSPGLAGNS